MTRAIGVQMLRTRRSSGEYLEVLAVLHGQAGDFGVSLLYLADDGICPEVKPGGRVRPRGRLC